MVENIIVFALGALVATLLALLVVPVIWRRALRLVEQRIRATTPLTMAEIKSEKDLVRADYAVQLRKVEVRYEEVKSQAAARQIELGRREARVFELETELGAREVDVEELEQKIEELQSNVLGLERQISSQNASLKEKQHTISSSNDSLRAAKAELDDISSTADARKVEIAALTTQLEAARGRIEELRADLATRSVESEGRASEVDELTGVLKGRDARIRALTNRVRRRRELSLERRRRARELADLLAAQRERVAEKTAALSAAALGKMKQEEDIRKLEEAGALLKSRIADLEAKLEIKDREVERLGKKEERMRTRKSAAMPSETDAAQLRESIADLAARITRMAALEGDDEVRALIDAVSADSRGVTTAAARRGERIPLAQRIKEVDLTPGE